ncbi:MAG: transglutaminase family protein [Candidatus Hydrogenedentes bacterium]|nr:transglutaminase family protein [Candidatus Hydrogenedentota bacterium]
MKYRISHTSRYDYAGSVPIGYNRAYLTPRNCATQECLRTQLEIKPAPAVFGQRTRDYYGNEVIFFTVQEQHSVLEVTARSEVRLTPLLTPEPGATPPWESVAEAMSRPVDSEARDAAQFTYPSEPAPVSNALRDYALLSFTPGMPVLAAALELTHRIYSEFAYDPTATTVTTPVAEILEKRAGVCQDFAHLQIGCLRALGLPARYISGYIAPRHVGSGEAYIGAQASHAWLSLFTPGAGWVDLDPTNDMVASTEHITIAWGRNYDEVSPIRGVILGGGSQKLAVDVQVSRVSE